MFPTDLDMRALYYEKLREAERLRRTAEARRLTPRAPERGRLTKDARSPLALGWLLRTILRAGAA